MRVSWYDISSIATVLGLDCLNHAMYVSRANVEMSIVSTVRVRICGLVV